MKPKEARVIFDRFLPGRTITSCTEYPDFYVFCAPPKGVDPKDAMDCLFRVDKQDGIVTTFYPLSMTPKELKKGKQIPIPK